MNKTLTGILGAAQGNSDLPANLITIGATVLGLTMMR
jgi:hypothetical protein